MERMTAALKSHVSSGADEFELPETLTPVVEDLKKEQQTLKKELEEVKARPVVRKQDESTRIFNLRQHQMELKIKELEDKKKTSEKELQEILQQKNSTLHTDLKKLAQFILQETRKVSSKIDSVSNIRNELQVIFESTLSDRKKTMGMVEDQNKAISEIGEVIRDTTKLLQGEYHYLTKDLERLHRDKEDEMKNLSGLKEEVARHHGIHEVIEKRKIDLREIEDKISLAEKDALSFARLDEELLSMKSQIHQLKTEKTDLQRENQRLQEMHFHSQESLARLKHQEAELEHNVANKKNQVTALESDILDSRKRLETTRNLEHEVKTQYSYHRDQLVTLQNEISRLEATKVTHLLMADESQAFFEERKGFFRRELDLIEGKNESRSAELEAQNEMRKLQWDTEFATYCEARKDELRNELEALDRNDLEDIRNKKSLLLEDISKTMSLILNTEGFQSSEERTKKARKDVEKTFELMFGKTRRWKFW